MKQRKLKVYTKFAKSGNQHSKNSEIRLSGKWVANWGFKNGSTVIVRNLGFGIIVLNNDIQKPLTIQL